jgi:hypothetical protein
VIGATLIPQQIRPWFSVTTRSVSRPGFTTNSLTAGVNLVNVRREFFRASPAEVRDVLARHQVSIIQWTDERRLENGSVILTYVPG